MTNPNVGYQQRTEQIQHALFTRFEEQCMD